MAIDFEEEEEQSKSKLAVCSVHKLRFDPTVTWGCVLCRQQKKKRIPGYVLVGGILAVIAGLSILLPTIKSSTSPNLSSVVSVSTNGAQDDGEKISGCVARLSKDVESCFFEAEVDGASRMDKEFCLASIEKVNCQGADALPEFSEGPYYFVNEGANWTDIKATFEKEQARFEKCTDGTYQFATRLVIDGATGSLKDATVSLFGLTSTQRYCIYEALNQISYPVCSGEYSFVVMIDNSILALNKPSEEDSRKAEFQKFLEQQREAKLQAEKQEAILKKREQINAEFKADIKKSGQ